MDDDPLFSMHPGSRRTAIIDRAGDAIWLYLTDPGESAPASDCWLANVPIDQAMSREELQASGLPPPAPPAVLEDHATDLPRSIEAYRLEWSAEGEAARVLVGSEPIAFIIAGRKLGYHRYLRDECPWGSPFDPQLHRELFG